MKKRSKILKVVSILMIIFSAVWIGICLVGVAALGILTDHTDVFILDLIIGFGKMFLIRLIVVKCVSLAAGVVGLSVRIKKPMKILGIIVLILTGISCATKFFIPLVWVLMALPILYLVGIGRCEE